MRTSAAAALAVAFGAANVAATPITKRENTGSVDDVTILNYALTLEHLENAFYRDALAQFDAAAFEAAGYPAWVRGRFSQIAEHEASHVELLSGALGEAAVQACEYTFPYTDPKSFAALAAVIENVGVSAYLGAAASIVDKTYLTVAGSILTTEARHQGWISSEVNKNEPWSGPYDTPVAFSPVYSVAAQFINPDSCPASNGALPFTAFPALTFTDGKVAFEGLSGENQYVVLYQGLNIATYPIGADGSVDLPETQGIAYITVSSEKNATMIGDENIIAGPAVVANNFNAYVSNPAPTFMSA